MHPLPKYSAFVLSDNGTWQQPTYWYDNRHTDKDIEEALKLQFDGFIVYGIQENEACPDEDVITLSYLPPLT